MIYCVSSKKSSRINLWRVNKATFRVVEFDTFTTLMRGSDYTILHEKLTSAFDALPKDEIELIPVKIYRKATNEEWDGFYELVIKEQITPETIHMANEKDRSVWQYDHYPFVSERIKHKLEAESDGKLKFSVGFREFA